MGELLPTRMPIVVERLGPPPLTVVLAGPQGPRRSPRLTREGIPIAIRSSLSEVREISRIEGGL